MPNSRHGGWEGFDSFDWLFDRSFEARDAMSALRSLRHREKGFLYYVDANGQRVVKKVEQIKFGPRGRAALVGDTDPTEEVA